MRKFTSVFLLGFLLVSVLGIGAVKVKTLDKASPKLANRVEGPLPSQNGVLKENPVILCVPFQTKCQDFT